MIEKFKGNDFSRENKKLIKERTTTFYRCETATTCGYDVRYRNGYGIQFSKSLNTGWSGYLIENTDNGWHPCYQNPMEECVPLEEVILVEKANELRKGCSYSNLTDEEIVELCKQLREC